jgi:hypothetical protein
MQPKARIEHREKRAGGGEAAMRASKCDLQEGMRTWCESTSTVSSPVSRPLRVHSQFDCGRLPSRVQTIAGRRSRAESLVACCPVPPSCSRSLCRSAAPRASSGARTLRCGGGSTRNWNWSCTGPPMKDQPVRREKTQTTAQKQAYATDQKIRRHTRQRQDSRTAR